MTPLPPTLPGALSALAPAGAALAASLAGRVAVGRAAAGSRQAWPPALAVAAMLVGWAMLAWPPASWWAPRTVVQHLPGAAVAVLAGAVAAVRLRGRAEAWAGTLGAGFAAWWIASGPAARPEAWRVWFAIMALTWLLRRMKAGEARPAVALSLTLSLGLAAATAPLAAVVAALVVLAVALGTAVGRTGPIPPAALAVALVASAMGAGRVVQGGLVMADLSCAAAVAAAGLSGWAARGLQRRLGRRGSEVAAPVLLALAGVALAWVAARAARG